MPRATTRVRGVASGVTVAAVGFLLTRSATAASTTAALWLVAAGLVMPIWLRVLGVRTPVPNLTAAGLIGHVLWGLTLGGGFALGRRWLN